MKKYFALSSLVILIAACGSPVEMDCDKVYEILTQEEGTVGGIMLGDSWSEAESQMKLKHDYMTSAYHEVLGTFTLDYGHDQRRFVINCNLKNDLIQSIDIEIVDLEKNQKKIQKLHDRLVAHYTDYYPEEYQRLPGDFGDYGIWRVVNGEENLTINSPTRIGNAPGAIKCYNIDMGLYKEI